MVEDFNSNYNSGWIKFFRSILNHWLWPKNKKLTYLEAWLLMLLTVNHSDEKCLIGYEVIDCKRGQKLYSLQNWASLFNWSVQNVRTFFRLLENDGMIEVEGMQKTTRLTICNYDTYQGDQQASNKQVTSKQQANNNNIRIKELKNEKKINEYIYPDFSEFKNYALENQSDTDINKLNLKYKAWVSDGWYDGKGKKIKNWKSKLLNTLPYLKNEQNAKNITGYEKHKHWQIPSGNNKTTWDD